MAKGAYIGVGGVARKVKQPLIGVDGVARKVKSGYVGVNSVARQFFSGVDPVFANNTWDQIISACQSGSVPDTWSVADQKTMTINGTDYAIDIIGKNHDDYADGSGKAPLTFQLHTAYSTKYKMHTWDSSRAGWKDCLMRSTYLPTIFSKMPSEVQAGIKNVNKITGKSGSTTLETTSDSLFLLSVFEIFGKKNAGSDTAAGEGKRYEYYTAGNPIQKMGSSESNAWWSRSTSPNYAGYFSEIWGTGNVGTFPNDNRYVSFAFCF